MNAFNYAGPERRVLNVEDVAVPDIVRAVGTPAYVYSAGYFRSRYQALSRALGERTRICFAVKANSNLAVLRLFSDLGAGFDIVSGGELQRVLAAGGDAHSVVFSGVGKSTEELDLALKLGIRCFNVESRGELDRLAARAELLGRAARIALRVNPDVDAATHPYISTGLKENKFGVPPELAVTLYEAAAVNPWLEPTGIACHIGSQISSPEPMLLALDSLLSVTDRLRERGIRLEHVDMGGGFGVTYSNEPEFDIRSYGSRVAAALAGRELQLSVEPGRYLVANGGILVTRVEYLKPALEEGARSFAVVDAAMNDLIRPALYQAWHGVDPVLLSDDGTAARWDVVGPVCESGDFIARDRSMTLSPGDLLAIRSAGAYGFVQSSNYNTRPRPPEVLVEGGKFRVVRRRETIEDLLRQEYPA